VGAARDLIGMRAGKGEYGAWVRLDGRRDGALAARFVGAVFMEDFASVLDCVALRPAHFAQVESLSLAVLRSEAFQMTRRPRLFFYVPPVGWRGVPSGPTANWYPTDFPRNLSNIVVPPAVSIEIEPARAIEDGLSQLGAGLTVESSARDDITSTGGVKGACLRLHGLRAGRSEPIYREMAMFVIGTRAYRMRLETTNAPKLLELREVFRGVVASFRPLPSEEETRSGEAFKAPSNFFDHWAN